MKSILETLDRISTDPKDPISDDHLSYLLAFEFIVISEEGIVSLTKQGEKLLEKFGGE